MKAILKACEPKLLEMGNQRHQGFSFGKLLGAEAAVFAAACFSMVDATREACNDMPESHPQCALFELQTPHLRLELIAQVAVGLLVPDAPFPEDLPELHATYLAVWDNILTQVQMEIDMDEGPATVTIEETLHAKFVAQSDKAGTPVNPCATADPQELNTILQQNKCQLDGVRAPAIPPVPSPIDWEKQSGSFLDHDFNDLVLIGTAAGVREMENKKKLARRMEKDSAAAAEAEAEGRPPRSTRPIPAGSDFDPMSIIKPMSNLSDSGAMSFANGAKPSSNPTPAKMITMAADPEHRGQQWRLLLLACIDECTRGFSLIKLSFDSRDMDAWTMQFRMLVGARFQASPAIQEMGGGNVSDRKDVGERARYAKLLKYVGTMRAEHEDGWRPARTARAEATLKLLKPPRPSGYPMLRPENFNNGKLTTTMAMLRAEAVAPDIMAVLGVVRNLGQRVSGADEGGSDLSRLMRVRIRAVQTWGGTCWWMLPWHLAMAAGGRNYDVLADRLAALATLSDDVMESSPAPWAPSLGVFARDIGAGAPGAEMTAPWHWREAMEASEAADAAERTRCYRCEAADTADSHRRCGGCLVARYCSPVCQQSDWVDHKVRCKRWQELASKSSKNKANF